MTHGYPVEILPKKEYELRLDIHSLLQVYPNLYVVRRIDGSRENLICQIDGDYVLSDEALKKIGVANFSVNLLGGNFDTERHLSYRPFDHITKLWDGEDIIRLAISEDMFEIKDSCFAVYYKVDDFLKFPMKQEVPFNKETEYTAFRTRAVANGADERYFEAFNKGITIVFPVNQRANHMPTYCNYWHVTFDTYSFDSPQIPIENNDSHGPIKRILRHLRHDFLTMQGIIKIPEYDTIAPYFYQKGKCNVLRRKFTTYVYRMGRLCKNRLKINL